MKISNYLPIILLIANAPASLAQTVEDEPSHELEEVTVSQRGPSKMDLRGAINGTKINRDELFKAACCNLGESFTTNPSVDVNYTDAATGARQIKLLGLSGTYVQMLTENMPNFRGLAMPYSLGYVPGAWMKSIQISKGASSVKNGYESITGQIDIEYLKPDDQQGITVNTFVNNEARFEANADANLHINKKLSTEVLAHYEDCYASTDMNHDKFEDRPDVRQVNVQNRWKYFGDKYIFHGGLSFLDENRRSGQTHATEAELYRIGIDTRRYEAYMKHAFILNKEKGTNIALIASGSHHETDAYYGHKLYNADQQNAYGQLMFETNFGSRQSLSTGASIVFDEIQQDTRFGNDIATGIVSQTERETTPGLYAQYTYNLNDKVIAMAGVRLDHSSNYGTFFTPRFHLKYTPVKVLTLRASAGKGYRTPHALAENNHLLASGRTVIVDNLKQEEAWNSGISASLKIPVFERPLKINGEYYYTAFDQQTVIDYDSDPTIIHITNLNGSSYSHTMQIDATYSVIEDLEVTLAYRYNNAKTTYGGQLLDRILTSKNKGLVTASYKVDMAKWQFDATLQLNGGGRMPKPYIAADGLPSWNERYKSFAQLNLQITRWFRKFSIYIGGENLTNFKQSHPIINADMPWSNNFEPTLVWGPISGAMAYIGCRINIGREF